MDGRTQWREKGALEEEESATAAVVRAVAEAEGVGPLDLEPLNSVVDADALDRLVDSLDGRSDPAGVVQFAYSGYRVTVIGDGAIDVDELSD